MLEILWVKSRHKKIRSVRTGKERAKKNGRGCFNCSENISQAQNGCKLVENGYRFAKLRKYLCFCLFMQQRKIFCSNHRTSIFATNANFPEKRRYQLATFTNKKRKFNKTPRKCLNFRIRCISLFAKWGLVNLQEYIDFFNRKRPHRKLKLQTPDQFEENYMAGFASNC